MSTMSSIIARIGADAGPLREGLNDARRATKAAQDAMTADTKRALKERQQAQAQAAAGIRGAAGELAGILGAPIGVAGILSAGSSLINFAGELQDTSDGIGVTVETLQELQYAFGQSGAGSDDVRKSLTKLSESLTSARGGNEEMIKSFEGLGVTWSDIRSMTPDQVIIRISETAADAADPAQRLTQIIDVMGKSGAKLAPGLNSGAEAIRALRADAMKLTTDEVKALDDAGDMIASFWNKVKVGSAKALVGTINPASLVKEAPAGQSSGQATGTGSAFMGMGGVGFQPAAQATPLPDVAIPDPTKNPLLSAEDQQRIAAPEPPPPSDIRPGEMSPAEARAKAAMEAADKAQFENEKSWREQELQQFSEFGAQKEKQTKSLAQLQRTADDEALSAAAKLAGRTSLRGRMEMERLATAKRIADLQGDAAAEGDPVKRAGIENEISQAKAEQRSQALDALDLEKKIAQASLEVADAKTLATIQDLKGRGVAGERAAATLETKLYTEQIARNTAEMKNADELRTAELEKQNIQLAAQIQSVDAIQRKQFIADKRDPNAARTRRREEARDQRLSERFEREKALRERGGRALADIKVVPDAAAIKKGVDKPPGPPPGVNSDVFKKAIDESSMAKNIATLAAKFGKAISKGGN